MNSNSDLLGLAQAICYLVLALSATQAEYDVATFCQLAGRDIKLPSLESCRRFYTCNTTEPIAHLCPAGQFFDKNAQVCKPEKLVDCIDSQEDSEQAPCAHRHREFIPDPESCNGYIYCVNGIEYWRNQCGPNMIFVDGLCMYGECQNEQSEQKPKPQPEKELRSVCQIMPNELYFGTTESCHMWLKCENGQLVSGNCPWNYIFNVNIHSCDYEDLSLCPHITGVSVIPEHQKPQPCDESETGLRKPDTRRCDIFWLCTSEMWIQFTCSPGQYYDSITHLCRRREDATPIATCSRCEGSNLQFVNMVDPQCQRYGVCSSGKLLGMGSCPLNTIFSESKQACTHVKVSNGTQFIEGPCYNQAHAI